MTYFERKKILYNNITDNYIKKLDEIIAEQQRLSYIAEQQRLADQKRLDDIAEKQRLDDIATQQRLDDIAEEQRLAFIAEQQRLASIAEQQRIQRREDKKVRIQAEREATKQADIFATKAMHDEMMRVRAAKNKRILAIKQIIEEQSNLPIYSTNILSNIVIASVKLNKYLNHSINSWIGSNTNMLKLKKNIDTELLETHLLSFFEKYVEKYDAKKFRMQPKISTQFNLSSSDNKIFTLYIINLFKKIHMYNMTMYNKYKKYKQKYLALLKTNLK